MPALPPLFFVHLHLAEVLYVYTVFSRKPSVNFTHANALAVRPLSSLATDGESGQSRFIDITLGARFDMPIEREGTFLVTRTMGDTPHLGLESACLERCVAEATRGDYKGVFGSPYFGFTETSLDCLRGLRELQSIWFWDVAFRDVEAVYELTQLRRFGIHPRRPAIDFSRLPSLESLTLHPVSKDRGFESLDSLKRFDLWHYSPKDKTFGSLPLPTSITELEINWANPKDLFGLSPNSNLIRLGIHRCRNLETISTLPELFPSLEHLVVTACGKLDGKRHISLAQNLPRLKHAYVQNYKVV